VVSTQVPLQSAIRLQKSNIFTLLQTQLSHQHSWDFGAKPWAVRNVHHAHYESPIWDQPIEDWWQGRPRCQYSHPIPPLFCQFRTTDFSSSKSTSVITWGETQHTVGDEDKLSSEGKVGIVAWKHLRKPSVWGSRIFGLSCNFVNVHAGSAWSEGLWLLRFYSIYLLKRRYCTYTQEADSLDTKHLWRRLFKNKYINFCKTNRWTWQA